MIFSRCQHHYHKECVHEWLGLNSKCPLCKRDFRGKNYSNDQEEEEEQY
jgi:E3 ubiquitin-protein ligase DOA10